MESKIDALTTLISQLAANQKSTPPPAKVCGICTSINHPTDACPSLQDSSIGWRNHPNLRWPNQQQQQQQQPSPPFQNNAGPSRYVPPPIQQQQQRQHEAPAPPAPQPSTSEPLLEELVRQMTLQNMPFQQETRASIQSLTNQMGQLATQLNQA
ncbi:protein FAM170B-like [Cajanus cajan]|uniref:protein FAM170B-like n=1 Tax=Cajanus cajan TaxID=3821 RepID=UPI00098DB61C|nr:protein FAM170B-like [Cajanus cajan]